MKHLKLLFITPIIFSTLLWGENIIQMPIKKPVQSRDTTFDIYGVGAKVDADHASHEGVGVMLDSEKLKIKLEATGDFFKSGLILKLNPFDDYWYFKGGANYLNKKMYAPDNATAKVTQYSGALSAGYMLKNDFYMELGASYTTLDGEIFSPTYKITGEDTKFAYLEAAKRWSISFGTIDAIANAGKVDYEFKPDETSCGAELDLYPADNAKIGVDYQYERSNIIRGYSAQYAFLFVQRSDNLSLHTYQVNMGIKIAFSDIFDTSTWRAPSKIKPHLSELHRFEELVFGTNMSILSSRGIE